MFGAQSFASADVNHLGYLDRGDLKIAMVAALGYKPSKVGVSLCPLHDLLLRRMILRSWFLGVVVITFALHAKGPGFEPRRNLSGLLFCFFVSVCCSFLSKVSILLSLFFSRLY